MTLLAPNVRLATMADMTQIHNIVMEPSINRFLNFEIMSEKEFTPIFQELLESGQFYVFEDNNTILAMCVVSRQKRRANHVVSLGTLATHLNYQRMGVASQFLNQLFELLKQQGVRRVDLCVEADNEIGQSFYKNLGFDCEGILKAYYKRPDENHYIDEHLMAKQIS